MSTRVIVWMLAVGLLALSVASAPVEAQSSIPPLPADLLFTTNLTEAWGVLPRNVIARVDAETLEVSPFYVDAEGYELMPLSWSPQGDLLAVYRRMPPIDPARTLFPRQLCILDRAGVLQRCLDDGPPMHYAGTPEDWQNYFPVAWGPDGQTIFFDTEYPNDESPYGYGHRLVEASVLTGETLRVVYDYPDPYQVTASPDLNHIMVGFGEEWGAGNNPAFIFDLMTETRLDVQDLMPTNTVLSWGCQPFSPQGNYFTARTWYDPARYAPEQNLPFSDGYLLLILDTQSGAIQGIIGEPNGSATLQYQDCPGWQPDEQAIVFCAYSSDHRYTMRYSLPDQQLTTLYELGGEPDHEYYVYSPLIPSPDGTHIALTVSDAPYGDRLVAVLYPDGEIYRIPSPYRFGLYPLWVPPLPSERQNVR